MIIPFLVSKSLSLEREREPCDARIETKINLSDCTYLTFVSITRTISTAARKERIHLSYLSWTFLSLFIPLSFIPSGLERRRKLAGGHNVGGNFRWSTGRPKRERGREKYRNIGEWQRPVKGRMCARRPHYSFEQRIPEGWYDTQKRREEKRRERERRGEAVSVCRRVMRAAVTESYLTCGYDGLPTRLLPLQHALLVSNLHLHLAPGVNARRTPTQLRLSYPWASRRGLAGLWYRWSRRARCISLVTSLLYKLTRFYGSFVNRQLITSRKLQRERIGDSWKFFSRDMNFYSWLGLQNNYSKYNV